MHQPGVADGERYTRLMKTVDHVAEESYQLLKVVEDIITAIVSSSRNVLHSLIFRKTNSWSEQIPRKEIFQTSKLELLLLVVAKSFHS